MTLSTPAELHARFAALTTRIAALDRDIALETDNERRTVAQAKRNDLAQEREQVAAELGLLGMAPPQSAPVEHRVAALEQEVSWIKRVLRPGPRQVVAKVVFFALLISAWSMWMVKEVRDWLITHPMQAIIITLALGVAALIIRWLPEADSHD